MNAMTTYRVVAAFLLAWVGCTMLRAQQFSVESFRVLSNDVSAFINPVRDLNDEDCALLKIQGDEDFVFSTPLGIVKREDKVGEIWIYLPPRSKKITLKHPRWGVLRDYVFPQRMESHITYEMRLKTPRAATEIEMPAPQVVVNTVHDTLVIAKVDTLVIEPVRKMIPMRYSVLATIGFGGRSKTTSGGIMLSLMKRHGGYVHLSTDFGHVGHTDGSCDKDGVINGVMPFYDSSRSYHRFYMVTAGAIHRISSCVAIFEGVGYGSNVVAWQLAESEGGQRVKNRYYSRRGVVFEVGTQVKYRRFAMMASVSTIGAREWYGAVGIGINIGK